MKKLLLIIFAAIIISGCKKSNGNAPSTNFTGKWYITTDSLAEYINGNMVAHSKTTIDHQGYLDFSADGSGYDDIIRQTTQGDNVDLDVYESFTYTASGNTVTFNIPAQSVGSEEVSASMVTATVQTHTNNNLTLVFNNSGTSGGNTYSEVQIETYSK